MRPGLELNFSMAQLGPLDFARQNIFPEKVIRKATHTFLQLPLGRFSSVMNDQLVIYSTDLRPANYVDYARQTFFGPT